MEVKDKPFSCDVCAKSFKRKDVLTEHERIHTGEQPFKCKLCDKSFRQRSGLREHKFRWHTVITPYKCEKCEKCFSQNYELKLHMMLHDNIRPFKCKLCDYAFRDRKGLRSHQLIHSGEKIHKCDICDMSFLRSHTLKTHIEGVHEGKFRVNKTNINPCSLCDKVYTMKHFLEQHEKTHIKRFKCDECEKVFAKKVNLNLHKMIHTSRRDFKCDICEKEFKLRAYLNRHKLSHLTEKKRKTFNCDVCDKSFDLKIHLSTHKHLEHGLNQKAGTGVDENIKLIKPEYDCNGHLDENADYSEDSLDKKKDLPPPNDANDKLFECPVCCLTFSFKNNLTRHLKTHEENKPKKEVSDETKFNCDQCDKSWPSEKKLKEHQECHLPMQFKCDLCGKGFRRPNQLRDHMNLHTGLRPYTCDICSKSFTKQNYLIYHKKKIHDQIDSKARSCNICSKIFTDQHKLDEHRLIHVDELPFRCETCPKAFKSVKARDLHIKNHPVKKLQVDTSKVKVDCQESEVDALDVKIEDKRSKFTDEDLEVKSVNVENGHLDEKNIDNEIFSDTKKNLTPPNEAVEKPFEKARYIHIKNRHLGKVKKVRGQKDEALKVKVRGPKSKLKIVDPAVKSDNECPVCCLTFSFKNNLTRHLKTHEDKKPKLTVSDETKFNCDQCDKSFPSEKKFKRHILSHQPMQFKCNLCGKGVRFPNQLRDHMNLHTGQQPYRCDICGISFAILPYLINHKRNKHKHIESKACTCNICNTIFTDQQKLDEHRMVHIDELPFRCETCPKAYKSKEARDLHIKNHPVGELQVDTSKVKKLKVRIKNLNLGKMEEDESQNHKKRKHILAQLKAVKCNICEQVFKGHHKLDEHRMVHVDKLPFRCETCPKAYKTKQGLDVHFQNHHGTKLKSEILRMKVEESDVNCESEENKEEEGLAFFCGICEQRITSDSDLYDIHIQGNCPENDVDSDNDILTEVPVTFEGNNDETEKEFQDCENDLDETNQNGSEIDPYVEHQETDNESSDEFEIEYENNDIDEEDNNDINGESFINDFKEAVNEIMLNKNDEPMNNSYEPQNNSYEPMNNSYEPQNNSYEPMNKNDEPMNNSDELMDSSVELLNKGDDSLHSIYIVKAEPIDLDD